MTTDFDNRLRMLLLGGYGASLLLNSVQLLHHTSIPFVFAIAYIVYKLFYVFTTRRGISIRLEGGVVVVLYLYMIGSEWLLHNGSINNAYYISYGLNCGMFLLLVDEYFQNSVVREKVMRFYVAAAVAVSIFVMLGVMTTVSSSGRTTFLKNNENELAASLLIAYVYISNKLVHAGLKNISFLLIELLSSIVLLNAIMATGTRFAMVGAVLVLLLLIPIAVIDRKKMQICFIYSAANITLIAFKITNLPLLFGNSVANNMVARNVTATNIVTRSMVVERWSPKVYGNNLYDIGGRVPIWQDAIDAFMQSPFVGLGYDGYQRFVLMRHRFFSLPHNFPLELAAIAGAVGVLMLIVVGLAVTWRILVLKDRERMLNVFMWYVPVLIILLMLNITDLKIFWFLLAYLMTLNSDTRISAAYQNESQELSAIAPL